ncbi:MAG: bifunctional phosphoglucose/phosphomannose isomerase [Patescibacteria group bacterium]
MAALDTVQQLVDLHDRENMLQSIRDFPDQIVDAWERFTTFVLPTHYIQVKEVVILGVGSSAMAAVMASRFAAEDSRIPVILHTTNTLPGHVDDRTLVIALSYTGQTEEVVTAFRDAARRGAKLLGISTGGEVGAICRKHRAPHFQIQYGAQPRAAFGYLFVPLLATLHRLAFISKTVERDLSEAVVALHELQAMVELTVPTVQNPAKQLAEKLAGAFPVIVSSHLLAPVALRWKQQCNQNAKHFAAVEQVPNLTHAAAAGLDYPKAIQPNLLFLYLRSGHDTAQESLQQNLFQTILRQNKLASEELVAKPQGSLLTEFLVLTHWADYVSYYLALTNGVDPTPVPHIMALREQEAAAQGLLR